MMPPKPSQKNQSRPGRRMPWEPRIRVDARDMARAEIRPRAAPPKPRRRRVHVPRPTPTRVSSEEDDAETDAAAAVALVVAAAQDAETADAATDAAVCRSRPRGPDDDTVSTLTTRRPPGEQGTDVEDDDDDLPDEASPRDFGAALADALALAEDPRHAELLTRVLEDCVGGKEAPPPPPQASVDAALEIAALLSADAAGEIARRRSVDSLDKSARKSPPPPAPATSKAVVAAAAARAAAAAPRGPVFGRFAAGPHPGARRAARGRRPRGGGVPAPPLARGPRGGCKWRGQAGDEPRARRGDEGGRGGLARAAARARPDARSTRARRARGPTPNPPRKLRPCVVRRRRRKDEWRRKVQCTDTG